MARKCVFRFFIIKLFCLLIGFVNIASAHGQNEYHQKDSLRKVIKEAKGEEKLTAYQSLLFWYMNHLTDDDAFDDFLNFIEEYDDYAKKMDDIEVQGDIRVNYLLSCMRMERFEEVEKNAPKALEFLKKNNLTEEYFVAYKQLVIAYCSQNHFEEALKELQAAYKEAQQENDNESQFHLQYLMGMIYMYQGKLEESEACYRTSIQVGEKITPKPFSYTIVCLELCNILQDSHQFVDFFAMIKQIESLIGEFEKENPNKSLTREKFNLLKLSELRTLYEMDKHIAEKERNRNYFLFALGGCVLMFIILGIWIYYNRAIIRKNRGLYSQIKEQDRLRNVITKSSGSKMQRQLVSRLREYLLEEKRFANFDIDIQELTTKLATNRTSLFEALKTITGKTPMEFINALRLDEAKQLLENSDLTIEAIAVECGFNTSRTFYRQFRERYRITPTEYRKFNSLNV